MYSNEKPMQCKTSTAIELLVISPLNNIHTFNRSKYPHMMMYNALRIPFLTLGFAHPYCGFRISKYVNINPETVKKTGAVTPLKYFQVA